MEAECSSETLVIYFSPYGFTVQNTNIDIFTDVRNLNLSYRTTLALTSWLHWLSLDPGCHGDCFDPRQMDGPLSGGGGLTV
jgi:hypothetical protein